ncbi:MAG: S1C family serine protease [Acidiferrobacterales bacterium]|nr:S1C family serine protease [Acidiferrobacterales bacterium]
MKIFLILSNKSYGRTLLFSVLAFFLATAGLKAKSKEVENTEVTINAIVSVKAQVPTSARLANVLGTRREGSGIVIDGDGLVLTIGYLILEASDIVVSNSRNELVPAQVVAYDYDTGFGLVRALEPLGIEAIEIGRSKDIAIGDESLVVSYVGPNFLQEVEVVDIRDFPGYWEYLLEDAIFTAPLFREFGGAALINKTGQLVGVGSLIVPNARSGDDPLGGNMFVPVDQLKPILNDLLKYGRRVGASRPWLGVYTEMNRGKLVVTRVANDSPAERADLRSNDIIISVNGNEVADMSGFYRHVWSSGNAGVEIELTISRNEEALTVSLVTEDRYDWLKLNPRSKYITQL